MTVILTIALVWAGILGIAAALGLLTKIIRGIIHTGGFIGDHLRALVEPEERKALELRKKQEEAFRRIRRELH